MRRGERSGNEFSGDHRIRVARLDVGGKYAYEKGKLRLERVERAHGCVGEPFGQQVVDILDGLFAEIAGGVGGCCHSRGFEEFEQTDPAASAFFAELIASVLIVDGAQYVGEKFGVGLFDGVFVDEVAAGVCGASGVVVCREAVGDIVVELYNGWLTEGPFGKEAMTISIHVIGRHAHREVFVHGDATFHE